MDIISPILALPTELRLHIYRYVIHLDVDIPEHATPKSLSDRVPWLNLLKTCRTVANELRELITSKEFQKQASNYTWEVEVTLEPTNKDWFRPKWTRQRAPCKPTDATAVVLNMEIPAYSALVNEAGSIVQWAACNFYEALTTYGLPFHASGGSLSPPVKFPEVTINIWRYVSSEPRQFMVSFYAFVQQHFFKHGFVPEDLQLNVLEDRDGQTVTIGRLRFLGQRLAETSDPRLEQMIRV